MSKPDYLSSSQQTLIKVATALSQDPLTPKAPAQLVTDDLSRDQVFRALKNLEAAGWAEQVADAWRISGRLTHISERVRVAIADVHHHYLGGKP